MISEEFKWLPGIVGSGSLQSKKNVNNFCILQDIHTGLVPFKSAQKPAFGDIYFHGIAAQECMQLKITILAYGSIMTISRYLCCVQTSKMLITTLCTVRMQHLFP